MSQIVEAFRIAQFELGHSRSHIRLIIFDSLLAPLAIAYLGYRLLDDPERLRWWMCGAIALGLCFGCFSYSGYTLLRDRFGGRLALIRTCPVSKAGYFGGRILSVLPSSLSVVGSGLLCLWALGLFEPTIAGRDGAPHQFATP